MSHTQIRDYFFKEGLIFYDSVINGAFSLERDLTPSLFESFARKTGISTSMDKEDVLSNMGLVTQKGMTNAGCLLLAEKPSHFIVSATLSCALFQGTTKTKILDQKVYEGDISELYQKGLIYLLSHLNTEFIIGSQREEQLELPEAALREALINALAHRDYRSSANVQVFIFQDRVEMVNPGGLVGGLTLKDLGKRSAPRNPLLFGILQRMGLVENIGSGISRISEELEERHLPGPKFDVDDNWFSLIFPRTMKSSQKSSQKITSLMAENPDITIAKLSEAVGIGERAIKKQIASLQSQNKIARIGPDKGGHWKVIN